MKRFFLVSTILAVTFGQLSPPLYKSYYYNGEDSGMFATKQEWSLNVGDPEEFRPAVFRVCQTVFEGPWAQMTMDRMVYYELGVSVVDRKYYCGLLDQDSEDGVVVFYGPARSHIVGFEAQIAATYASLGRQQAERNITIGPKILRSFEGGHIEEFLPGTYYSVSENNLGYADEIFRKVALLHSLRVENLAPTTDQFWDYVEKVVNQTVIDCDQGRSSFFSESTQAAIDRFNKFDFNDEMNFVKTLMEDMKGPVLYSPMRLGDHEIMYNPHPLTKDDKVFFDDVGVGFNTYRAFPLAMYLNSFEESIIEITPYPHFKEVGAELKSEEVIQLAAQYVSVTKGGTSSVTLAELSGLLEEMSRASLLAQLISSIQAMHNALNNYGKRIGFPELADYRIKRYLMEKEAFLKERPELAKFDIDLDDDDHINLIAPSNSIGAPADNEQPELEVELETHSHEGHQQTESGDGQLVVVDRVGAGEASLRSILSQEAANGVGHDAHEEASQQALQEAQNLQGLTSLESQAINQELQQSAQSNFMELLANYMRDRQRTGQASISSQVSSVSSPNVQYSETLPTSDSIGQASSLRRDRFTRQFDRLNRQQQLLIAQELEEHQLELQHQRDKVELERRQNQALTHIELEQLEQQRLEVALQRQQEESKIVAQRLRNEATHQRQRMVEMASQWEAKARENQARRRFQEREQFKVLVEQNQQQLALDERQRHEWLLREQLHHRRMPGNELQAASALQWQLRRARMSIRPNYYNVMDYQMAAPQWEQFGPYNIPPNHWAIEQQMLQQQAHGQSQFTGLQPGSPVAGPGPVFLMTPRDIEMTQATAVHGAYLAAHGPGGAMPIVPPTDSEKSVFVPNGPSGNSVPPLHSISSFA